MMQIKSRGNGVVALSRILEWATQSQSKSKSKSHRSSPCHAGQSWIISVTCTVSALFLNPPHQPPQDPPYSSPLPAKLFSSPTPTNPSSFPILANVSTQSIARRSMSNKSPVVIMIRNFISPRNVAMPPPLDKFSLRLMIR